MYLKVVQHTASEIRERYENHLRKGIKRDKWTVEEDLELLKLVEKHESKWGKISEELNGRTERQVKNRYCRTLLPVLKKLQETKDHSPKQEQARKKKY